MLLRLRNCLSTYAKEPLRGWYLYIGFTMLYSNILTDTSVLSSFSRTLSFSLTPSISPLRLPSSRELPRWPPLSLRVQEAEVSRGYQPSCRISVLGLASNFRSRSRSRPFPRPFRRSLRGSPSGFTARRVPRENGTRSNGNTFGDDRFLPSPEGNEEKPKKARLMRIVGRRLGVTFDYNYYFNVYSFLCYQ